MKLLPLLAALLLLSCDSSVGPNNLPDAPAGLRVSSIDSASVRLAWDSVGDAVSYEVAWFRPNATDTMRVIVATTRHTVTGLLAGESIFLVRALTSAGASAWKSIRWAPAKRFTQDASNPMVTLRMYEFASVNGSSVILDPAEGGPRNRSIGGQWNYLSHLAINTNITSSTEFQIGPTYAFLEFRNANFFDSTSYIGRTLYHAASLDDHFLDAAFKSNFEPSGSAAGNVSWFTLPNEKPDGKGVVLLLRYGNDDRRHYARIFVRNVGGKLMQGRAPNRYVEIEMSWQSVAGVPYA